MKKKYVVGLLAVAAGVLLALLGLFFLKKQYDEKNQSGILLSFDDYDTTSWESMFDLFDEYDVKVTFFVNAFGPSDFCEKARERGHDIGFHTIGHMDLTTLSEETIREQAIDPIEEFRSQGYDFLAFSYPFGKYSEETNQLLLQHYDVLRGAYYHELRDRDAVKGTFIESKSIDNINYVDDAHFKNEIMAVLLEAYENPGTVVSLYSHSINDWAQWAVPVERLEFIFETAQNLGLKFYTYSDLVK